jgi:hypothetical protein
MQIRRNYTIIQELIMLVYDSNMFGLILACSIDVNALFIKNGVLTEVNPLIFFTQKRIFLSIA